MSINLQIPPAFDEESPVTSYTTFRNIELARHADGHFSVGSKHFVGTAAQLASVIECACEGRPVLHNADFSE